MKRLIAGVAMLVMCGCGGGGDSSSQPPTNVSGIWNGILLTYIGTSFTTFTIKQTGSSVSGSYSTPSGTGSVTGSVNSNILTFTIRPTGCTGYVSGKGTINGSQMSVDFNGTYTCNGLKLSNINGAGILTKVSS